jgi:hypothetical protein
MAKIDSAEKIIRNAMNSFIWDLKLYLDIKENKYKPNFDGKIEIEDSDRAIKYTLSNIPISSLEGQALNQVVMSLGNCVTSIWEEWLIYQPIDKIKDTDFKSLRQIFRRLRNVFQHGAYNPHWEIKKKEERVLIEFNPTLKNMELKKVSPIRLNLEELHEERFNIGHINGVCGFIFLLEWLHSWVDENKDKVDFKTKSDVLSKRIKNK